ncbi:MAG: Uncharacterized protein G01um10145_757 [Microgenomates group bacterium Gr01-1014_5]|nr:MAG: Uncharacterized protein G01um10145_757 [Microgenomates group bacterium Gr01-1014_5]
MIIIVDSDGLIGTSQEDDAHYSNSILLLQKLTRAKARLIYPATVIAEATAILQIRLNRQETANKIFELVKTGAFTIEPINQEILTTAIRLLKTNRNKHATLFDAIVATVAQKYNADAIFSFDNFYKKKGFKLASEL